MNLTLYNSLLKKKEEEEKKITSHSTTSTKAHETLAKKQSQIATKQEEQKANEEKKAADTYNILAKATSSKTAPAEAPIKETPVEVKNEISSAGDTRVAGNTYEGPGVGEMAADVIANIGAGLKSNLANKIANAANVLRTVNLNKNIELLDEEALIRYANGERDASAILNFSRLKNSDEAKAVPFVAVLVDDIEKGRYKGDTTKLADDLKRGKNQLQIQTINKYAKSSNDFYAGTSHTLEEKYGEAGKLVNTINQFGTGIATFSIDLATGLPVPVASGIQAFNRSTSNDAYRMSHEGKSASSLAKDTTIDFIKYAAFAAALQAATPALNSGISPTQSWYGNPASLARLSRAAVNGFLTAAGISLGTQTLDILKDDPNYDFIDWKHVEEGYKNGEYKTLDDYLNSYQFEQDVIKGRGTQAGFAGFMGALINMWRIGTNPGIGSTKLPDTKSKVPTNSDKQDAYRVLGLKEGASIEEITAKRNWFAKQFHPDVNPNGEELMKAVNNAYDVLTGKTPGVSNLQSTFDAANGGIVPTNNTPATGGTPPTTNSSITVPPTNVYTPQTQLQTQTQNKPVTYKDPEKVMDVQKLLDHWVKPENKANKPYVDNLKERLRTGQGATEVIDELAEENGVSPTEILRDIGITVPPVNTTNNAAETKPVTNTQEATTDSSGLKDTVRPMLDEKKIEDEMLKIMGEYDDIGAFDDRTLDKIERRAVQKVFDEFMDTDMGKRVAASYKDGKLQPLEATKEDYSDGYTASDGTPITNGIAKWAKNSTTKDDDKLVPYYHGSPFLFDEFKDTYIHNGRSLGDGYYLTKNQKRAKNTYAYDDKDTVYKFILNVKNPFNEETWKKDKQEILAKVPDLVEKFDKEGVKNTKFSGGKADYIDQMVYEFDYGAHSLEDEPTADDIIDLVKDIAKRNGEDTRDIWKFLGYDGIQDGDDVVIFDSNQAKRLDNPNPTKDTRFGYFASRRGGKLTGESTNGKLNPKLGGTENGEKNRRNVERKNDQTLWEELENGSGTETSELNYQLWQKQTASAKEVEKQLTLVEELNEAQKIIQDSFKNNYGITVKFFSNDMEFLGCATSEGVIYLNSKLHKQELIYIAQHELAEEALLKASKTGLKKFDGLINLTSLNKPVINRYIEELLAPADGKEREDVIEYYKTFPREAAKEAVCDMCGYDLLHPKSEYGKALREIFGAKYIAAIKTELDKIIKETDFTKKKEGPKNLGFDSVDKDKEALEQAANKLRDELAKQKKDYEDRLKKKDEELEQYKQNQKKKDLKRKTRLEVKKKKDTEAKRFKSATPKGKLRMLGRKIEKQTGYYEVNNFPELDEVYEREFGKTIRQTIETLYKREVFPYLPAKMQDVVNTFRDETYLKSNWKTFDKYLREALEIDELKQFMDDDTPVAKKLLERIKVHNTAPITIKNAREMYEDLLLLQDIVDYAEQKMSYKRVNEEIDKTLTKAKDELDTAAKINMPKSFTDGSAKLGKLKDLSRKLKEQPQWLKTRIQMLMGGNPNSALKIIWDWFYEGNEKEMELDVAFARNFEKFTERASGAGFKYVKDLENDFGEKAKPINTGITGSSPDGKKYEEEAKLSKDIIMHIVASSKNQDNLMSFCKVLLGTDFEGKPVYSNPGGYVVPDQYWLDRGNVDKAYSQGKKYVFTMQEIKHLESLLNNTEKEFVEAALNVGKITAKYGNEVSQKLVGRDIFTVENYIRIIRDPNTLDQELIDPAKLENLANALSKDFVGIEGILGRGGSLEARNHRSTRPIYGESLLQSVTRSFKGAKKYIAYAIPLYDTDMLLKSRLPDTFKKVATVTDKPKSTRDLSYISVDELPRNGASHTRYYIDNGNSYDIYEVEKKGDSLRELITNTGDKGFLDYYQKFVDNILGRTRKYSPISSLRAKVVLNANLRVAATQFFSYFQMGQFLEHPVSSMVKGVVDKTSIYSLAKEFLESKGEDVAGLKKRDVINKMWEEVTFLNTFRGLGFSSPDVDYIEAGSSMLGRVNNGALMKAVDRFTVDATFRALAEDLIAQGYKFGTYEFFNAYKQKLYSIYQSNPQYAKIYKTPLQTSYGALSTALSQFNTVMIEGYNNVLQARMAEDYYKKIGDKTNLKKSRNLLMKALLGLATSGLLLVMMRDALDRMSGKENDEEYAKKIALDLISNILSYTIVGDEIFSALINRDKYDITTNELSYAQNVLDTITDYGKAITGGSPSDWIKAVKGTLNIIGVPASGIENIFKMIGNATDSKVFKAYSVMKNKTQYEQYLKNEELIDGDIATFYDMKKVINEKVLTEDYDYIKGSKANTYNSKGSAKARAIRDVLGYPETKPLSKAQQEEYNRWYEVFKNS